MPRESSAFALDRHRRISSLSPFTSHGPTPRAPRADPTSTVHIQVTYASWFPKSTRLELQRLSTTRKYGNESQYTATHVFAADGTTKVGVLFHTAPLDGPVQSAIDALPNIGMVNLYSTVGFELATRIECVCRTTPSDDGYPPSFYISYTGFQAK
jgi:hypothetical protein